MRWIHSLSAVVLVSLLAFSLSVRADDNDSSSYPAKHAHKLHSKSFVDFPDRIPQKIDGYGENAIVVYPHVHAWGAYDAEGNLVRAGEATAGSSWCRDTHRPCRTKVGSFRIETLGSHGCKSSIYPLPRGGAPMPYCMFFNHNQALHGSYEVVDGNASHGCVRLHVEDAKWIRYNFATIGTKVVIKPY